MNEEHDRARAPLPALEPFQCSGALTYSSSGLVVALPLDIVFFKQICFRFSTNARTLKVEPRIGIGQSEVRVVALG